MPRDRPASLAELRGPDRRWRLAGRAKPPRRAPQRRWQTPRVALGWTRARVADPRDVGEDCARAIELSPQVEQHDLARPDGPMIGFRRHVVRVAGVAGRRHDGRRIAHQPFVSKPARHQLLNVVLGRRRARGHPRGDGGKRLIFDAIQLLRCALVSIDRGLVPDGREPLDEIAGRHDVDAELANQFDRARIDASQIGNRALRRIFHRDASHPGQQLAQSGLELRPGPRTVKSCRAGDRARRVRWHARAPGVRRTPGSGSTSGASRDVRRDG